MKMKRILAVGVTLALGGLTYATAQTMDDLVLYSLEDQTGSARAVGLGGALGAVGGDMASMAGNPAGLGMYRGMEFSGTVSLGGHAVRTRFVDQKSIARRLVPGFDGAAAIFSLRVGDVGKTSGLLRVNFGIGYNKLQSFRFRQSYKAEVNDGNSLLAAIASESNAQGLVGNNLLRGNSYVPYDTQPWFPAAAYGSYLMLDGSPKGTFKAPWILSGTAGFVDERLRQSVVKDSRGSLGEIDMSVAFNVTNRIYFGATLGIQLLEREVNTRMREETAEEKDAGLLWGQFNSYDRVKGAGVNLKLGALYRPVDALRIGLAFHTPTFMNVENRFSLSAHGEYRNPDTVYGEPEVPKTADSSGVYEGEFSYTGPMRAMASLAYSFGKRGLVTAEYEMTYLPLMQFSGMDYAQDNEDIEKYLLPTHEVRAGTEWFFGALGVRLGGGFRTSPYRADEFSPLRWRMYVSGGIGYYGSYFFCDFAYRHTIQPGEGYMYQMGGYQRAYDSRFYRGTGLLTFGFRF